MSRENWPTVALILLAVGQFSLLMFFYPLLGRLMRTGPMRALVSAIGARLMTIYLWHLPVLALIVGLLLLTPLPMPVPGSAACGGRVRWSCLLYTSDAADE